MITQRADETAETNYWQTTTLPLDRVARILGADHVAWLRVQAHPASFCDSRAAGSWTANAAESFCAYRSLAAHLRAGR
jgi:hypothetical protein